MLPDDRPGSDRNPAPTKHGDLTNGIQQPHERRPAQSAVLDARPVRDALRAELEHPGFSEGRASITVESNARNRVALARICLGC
jgi:hypothetical protein